MGNRPPFENRRQEHASLIEEQKPVNVANVAEQGSRRSCLPGQKQRGIQPRTTVTSRGRGFQPRDGETPLRSNTEWSGAGGRGPGDRAGNHPLLLGLCVCHQHQTPRDVGGIPPTSASAQGTPAFCITHACVHTSTCTCTHTRARTHTHTMATTSAHPQAPTAAERAFADSQ